MLYLERLGSITAELSANLVKAIVLPGRRPAGKAEGSRAEAPSRGAARAEESTRPYLPAGTAMLLGAAPIPDDAVVTCMRQVGGRNIKVVLVPACAPEPTACVPEVARTFTRYGIRDVEVLDVSSREQADKPHLAEAIAAAHVVVVCGSDPRLGRDVLAGSACHRALVRVLEQGRVVVGACGGAGVLGEKFATPGTGGHAEVSDGLGLLPGLVVPVGLDDKGSLSRFLHAVGSDLGAKYLGLGLDRATGVIIKDSETRVLGDGAVTIVDGRDVSAVPEESLTCACEVPMTAHEPPVCGLKVHVLVSGYGLNLKNRRPLGPPKDRLMAAGD